MTDRGTGRLSGRERDIMDAVYALGKASVAQVLETMPSPPSYSSVRTLMRILETKGHLRHEKVGNRYDYLPTRPRGAAARSALRRLVQTFFDGSASAMVAHLLEQTHPCPDELREIRKTLAAYQREQGDE